MADDKPENATEKRESRRIAACSFSFYLAAICAGAALLVGDDRRNVRWCLLGLVVLAMWCSTVLVNDGLEARNRSERKAVTLFLVVAIATASAKYAIPGETDAPIIAAAMLAVGFLLNRHHRELDRSPDTLRLPGLPEPQDAKDDR